MMQFWPMPWWMMTMWSLFWITVVVLVVVALWQLVRGEHRRREAPLAIAQRRYAAGEIGRTEFEEICRTLSQTADPASDTPKTFNTPIR